ncbi:hypothetical protein LINGRAHAP2_LOCUS5034 [Linum grandiflorum]
MRLHNLAGLLRFLFTIKEEEKEYLESECDRRSRKRSRTRSLSGILRDADNTSTTPLFTPLVSHRFANPLDSYNRRDSILTSCSNRRLKLDPCHRRPSSSSCETLGKKLQGNSCSRVIEASVSSNEGGSQKRVVSRIFYAKNNNYNNREAATVHRLPKVIPLASSPS